MSAAVPPAGATGAAVPPLTVPPPAGGPSLARLTAVELRKMVDTRAGAWIVGLIAAASVAVLVLALVVGSGAERDLAAFFGLTLLPAAVALPVLGILTATTEWSQRTALTTFALVPDRRRVVGAKLLAAVGWALLVLVASLAAAAVATLLTRLLDRGSGDWSLPPTMLATAALVMALLVVMGLAFGLLVGSTPAAIVLFFLLPTAWSITGELVPGLDGVAAWLDLDRATAPLGTAGPISAGQWARAGTASALWVALPLVLGAARTLRREVA